jgi:phospholipid/cholesterol/gamma-HCH transport system permease protein
MRTFGALLRLLAVTVQRTLSRGFPKRELARQLHEMGNRSLVLVFIGLGCFGAALVAHADHEAKPIVGDIALIGAPAFRLMVREFAPLLTGGLAALQLGSMIAAELGTMAQGEQLEAMVMCGGDPYSELVAPRVIAGVAVLPVLFAAGLLVASGCARLTATYAYGSDGKAWTSPLFTHGSDFAFAFVKVLLFGLAIPLAGAMHGLSARGGASAVGEATTRGAVTAFLSMLTIDLIAGIGSALYGAG